MDKEKKEKLDKLETQKELLEKAIQFHEKLKDYEMLDLALERLFKILQKIKELKQQ